MSDLISRQAAIDDAHKQIWYRMNRQEMKDRIDEWLNSLPSAQPEIIRCKDCKHRDVQRIKPGSSVIERIERDVYLK